MDLLPLPKVPPIVSELVAGIVIGPVALDIVDVTAPLEVFSQIGLVFLFFLAGLEIAFDARDRHLGIVGAAFVISLGLALAVARQARLRGRRGARHGRRALGAAVPRARGALDRLRCATSPSRSVPTFSRSTGRLNGARLSRMPLAATV